MCETWVGKVFKIFHLWAEVFSLETLNENLIMTASQSMILIQIILLILVDLIPRSDKKLEYLRILQEVCRKCYAG